MTNRRQYMFGAGTAAAALLGVGVSDTVLAQNAAPEGIYFTDVNAEGEYVVIENRSDSDVDLSGYYINFEYQDPTNQRKEFQSGTVIEAHSQLKIATGAEPVPDADVTFDYNVPRIHNTEPDNFAILMPDSETVVAKSDKTPSPPPTDTPTSTAAPEEETTAEADTTTESETAAQTASPTETTADTDTATATTTSAPETETAATTAEPTDTATGTSGGNATETSSEVDVDDGC